MNDFTPSPYQQAIFGFVEGGDGNGIVEAVAGSGKTTTIVNSVKKIPYGQTHIVIAFNKSIATELVSRGVNGSTFHSLALNALRPTLPSGFRIEGNKCSAIFRSIVAEELQDGLSELPRLVGLGKNYGIGLFPDIPNMPDTWLSLIDHHDLSFDNESKACEFACRILRMSNENDSTIDFDDMLYMALLRKCPFRSFSVVFVDEAQDTNGIQREILRRMDTGRTRFIFVGDRHQAIYGFRGAGTDSMELLRREFEAEYLPLSVSYRCSKTVVLKAQEIVPYIEYADGAILGSVQQLDKWSVNDIQPASVILCRTTKPIIRMAYNFLRQGRRVHVHGRDIGAGFKAILKKCKGKTIDEVYEKVGALRDKEVQKLRDRDQRGKAAATEDRFDSLLTIIEAIPSDSNPNNILDEIDKLFAASPGAIELATVHKSKGLEWKNVYILDADMLMPSPWANSDWEKAQEQNLIYVAITRAKLNLFYISSSALEK